MKRLLPFVLLALLGIAGALWVATTPSRTGDEGVGRSPSPRAGGGTDPTAPPAPVDRPGGRTETAAPPRALAPLPSATPGPAVCPASIGAAVRGRVLDASGAPAAGIGIWLGGWRGDAPTEAAARWKGETPIEEVARSSEAGEFLFRDLPPDFRYEVRAVARGLSPRAAGPVRPGPGELADVGDLLLRPGGRVTGRVVDAQDRPVRGVAVGAIPLPPGGDVDEAVPFADFDSGVPTGADGAFSLGDVPPGRALLVAEAFSVARTTTTVQVVEGAEVSGVVLRMSEGKTLAGAVEDSRGEEIEGGWVRAEPQGDGPAFLAEIDDFGEFEIESVPVGIAYRLVAESPGYEPGTAEARAGDEEIRIRLRPRGSVRGEVVDATDGSGVSYALVALVPDADDWRLPIRDLGSSAFRSFAEDDGSFALEAPSPGRYRVVAVAPGYAPAASGPLSVAGALQDEIEVKLHRGAEIRGVARGGGKLLPAEIALTEPPRAGPTASVPDASRVPSAGALLARTTADAQGRFAFARVPSGTYRIEATHAGFAAARTAPFDVKDGDARIEKTLELGRPGTIRGAVRGDAASLETLKVVALGPDGVPRESAIDGTGAFRIDGAAPGSHVLLLVPRTQPIADLYGADLDAAKRDARLHATVELAEGGEASADLDLSAKPGGGVRGAVRRNGVPAAGLVVAVAVERGAPPLARPGTEAVTDADGRFTIQGLSPGRATLVVRSAVRADAPRVVLGTTTVEVREGASSDVEIPLAVGRLRGRAVRADGAPAAGARVTISSEGEGRGGSGLLAEGTRWSLTAAEDGSFDGGEAPAGAYRFAVDLGSGAATPVAVVLSAAAEWIGEVRADDAAAK